MSALAGYGVSELFTLSGGHIFPILDASVRAGIRIVDTRHEQTAVFAAEGVAKLTRRPGVAALTAGPGVTNGISAITTSCFNGSPVVVLGGRAPQARWGSGSLQELDHVPLLAPVTKAARTVHETADIGPAVAAAAARALEPHRGPVFLDFPIDVVFSEAEGTVPPPERPRGQEPDPDQVAEAARLVAGARRPALLAGSDVWWEGAWDALARFVETARIPTFTNGLGRGCIPADGELAFSRTRGAMKEADVVVVVGTPLDFRVSFGRFGSAKVVHVVDAPGRQAQHAELAASPAGDLRTIFDAMSSLADRGDVDVADHEPWIERLRDDEKAKRLAESEQLTSDSVPVHPARVYGDLQARLDRDAIVIGDGGDFVSYAGRLLDSFEPGCWLDPGPYGCLGTGLGYAIAARVVHPDRQVVLLCGDGAFGFSAMDVDTLVRHGLPVVIVVGNNGSWGLEKHPMRSLYGYDVAADLQPQCRYDEVVRALGGAGEIVSAPQGIGPALDRAFASGVPYLVNVLTDPADAYPRSSNLG